MRVRLAPWHANLSYVRAQPEPLPATALGDEVPVEAFVATREAVVVPPGATGPGVTS